MDSQQVGLGPVEVPLPQSLEEAERLVQRLYLPGSAQEIPQIQEILQKLQRSSTGWQMADGLLQSQDANVRFFGALTLTIKINKDWESLSDDTATELRDRLLSWAIRLVSGAEGPLVVRKLCSALVAYFLRSSVTWDRCIKHFLCCFCTGDVTAANTLSQHVSMEQVMQQLQPPQLMCCLWFVSMLVEEVGKMSSKSPQTHVYYQRITSNLEDVVALLQYTLGTDTQSDLKLVQEGIKCFHGVVMYAHRAWINEPNALDLLRTTTPQLIRRLFEPKLFETIVEFLTEVLQVFSSFFTSSNSHALALLLCSTPAEEHISALIVGDFGGESTAFALMLLAFGDANVQKLASSIIEPLNLKILDSLIGLLQCNGFPVSEDEICSPAIEFWTTYIEHLTDTLFEEKEEPLPWMNQALEYVMKSIEACWAKIKLPLPEVAATWDTDIRSGFSSFRADVEDLIQSSFPLLGIGIFQRFIQLALSSVGNRAWLELEATLFCINALSDAISEDGIGDESLATLFNSHLFVYMSNDALAVPIKTQQTALALIHRYTNFFERHTEHLPAMLNFLFGAIRFPTLASGASKAISALCTSCRKALVGELGPFLQQYSAMTNSPHAESNAAKEHVTGAIAAIIQAIPSEEEQVRALGELLQFVEADVRQLVPLMNANNPEDAQIVGLCALRCLVSMGKGFQYPDDLPVDLDGDESPTSIWLREPGLLIQSRIVQCLRSVFEPMRTDGDIVEAACQILRCGFTETNPGPFVFPPYVTGEVVTSSTLSTARLGYILDTAGILLSRSSKKSSSEAVSVALGCLVFITRLLSAINHDPSNEPDIASSCIDLSERLIHTHVQQFYAPAVRDPISLLFEFNLNCLETPEIIPKRCAANFWSSFCKITDRPPETQQLVDLTLQKYGPLVAQALVRNIGGKAARSELDALTELLKDMIFKQPRAKTWLENALSDPPFPSQRVTETDKRIWLQKVMKLRGARGTNQIVKDFWMACRGTNLDYAS